MKLSNIRDILAVVETGSIRAASRRIGIAQPSMTRSVRDTENELGLSLFTRHAHGVTLTESGRLFVRRATVIQSELRHIFEELEQSKGHFTGQASVALSTAASIALMPYVVSNFAKKFPGALLKMTESLYQPVEANILSGEIDFFVGPLYNEMCAPSLMSEKLFDNRRMVIARKGHPLAHAKSLAELNGAQWIRPSFSNHFDETDFVAMFERAGLPAPKVVVHTGSIMTTLLAVAHSDLLTILPVQWLEFSPSGERVEAIELSENLQAAPVCIVRRSDVPLTPLAEAICDMTRKAGLNYGRKLASL